MLVVSVVVVTGCLSLGGSGGPSGPLPPGVADDGSVNESALFAAHSAAANETTVRLRAQVDEGQRVVYRRNRTAYASGREGVTFTDGRLTATNATAGGTDYRVTYSRNTSIDGPSAGSAALTAFAMQLRFLEYEHAGTRTVNGTDRHELSVSRSAAYATGTMLVDERGRIHSLTGELGANESAASPYDYQFTWDVGEVPRPAWLDAVPRGTAAKTANGTTFAVALTDGPALPAGTELEFSHDGRSYPVTLNESLAPGDTLALGLRGTDGEGALVVGRDALADASLADLRGTRTSLRGTVTLPDGTTVALSFAVGSLDV